MLTYVDFLYSFATFLVIMMVTRALKKKSVSRRYPPSLPSLPLVGSLPFIWKFENLHEYFMSKVDQLGPIFTYRDGRKLCLTLNSREVIEEALVRNSACYAGREHFYMERLTNKNEKGIIGKNYTADFKRYHQLSLSILKEFGFGRKHLIERRISEEFEEMEAFICTKDGKDFDPSDMCGICTYNVIKNILFGERIVYENGPDEIIKLTTILVQSLDPALDVAPNFLRLFPYFSKKINIYVGSMSKVLDIVKTDIENSKKDGPVECFLSSYLEKIGPVYDYEQLLYTVKDLIGAGSETSGTALLWLLVFVANNPEIQERLQKEIDDVIPRHRLPSLDDQTKLPFVEATILEVMRFRTIVPIGIPRLTLSDSEVCGYFIPAGTKVLPNLHAAHMDPKRWENPEVFRPERFLDGDEHITGSEGVIPFSLGRRSCLGEMLARQEIFLFLAGWIQRFNIRPGEDGQRIDDIPVIEMTMKPRPFTIRMIPREA